MQFFNEIFANSAYEKQNEEAVKVNETIPIDFSKLLMSLCF